MPPEADSRRHGGGHARLRRLAPDAGPAAAESPRIVLQMPVDVRSASLVVLAVIASLFALRVASAVFIPVLLGLMFSYALSPVVNRLAKWRLPRSLASAIVVASVVLLLAWTASSMKDDAMR